MKIAPAGDRAVLVDLGSVSAAELHGAAAAVRELPDVIACVAGHSSIFVVCRATPLLPAITDSVRGARPRERPGNVHRIPVSFRDEYAIDLPEFLARTSSSRQEFLKGVAGLRLGVRFIGFRGGFGYLDGWPAEWAMPRRPTSRPRVTRGSFGIAGSIAGFYPIDSPGGWNILGRAGVDLEHALEPGDVIEIEPVEDVLAPINAGEGAGATLSTLAPIRIVHGPLARWVGPEDWSRVGRGVSPGGPFDVEAAQAANRAVGNADDAPVLECALVGPRIVAERDLVLAWFGARADILSQFEVSAGTEINIGRLTGGARGYLAAGVSRGEITKLDRDDRLVIRAAAGPHEPAIRAMTCEVTPHLDRVGIRMRVIEPQLARAPADLPSCGMTTGTIQLHPDGHAVVMGPDHPVTGGYLQPMTVISSERWKIAQLAPGDRVRFVADYLSP
ncbi:MAG TPA: carboxyltransferase domain-containing protein [Thermoanaerobaculia bacterium]